MTQFDPQMVAQMLMQPVGKESLDNSIAEENFFQPVEIPTQGMVAPFDMQGGFFKGSDTDNQDMTVEPGMLLPFERTAEGRLQFATPQLVAGILEGLQQAGQTIQKGVSGDPMFVPVDGRLSEQAIDEITNLGLTMGGTAYTGSSLIPGLVPEGVLASTLKSSKKTTDVASDVAGIAKVEPPTDTQPGIIAFHGSGADFDEFRLDKIGTGEGAQAFGYGLYFTDSEDIANFYKRQLTGSSFKTKDGKIFDPYTMDIDGQPIIKNPNIRTSIADSDGDIDKPIARAERIIANSPNTEASELAEKDLLILRDLKAKGGFTVNKGKTYKVGLEPKIDELLDYDKPLSEQPKNVQDFYKNFKNSELGKLANESLANELDRVTNPTGERIYGYVVEGAAAKIFGDNPSRELVQQIQKNKDDYKLVTEELLKSDIKGIKFKSGQLSGIKDSEATNFVIFDDKIIKILEKYGIVGPVAVSATAAALRDDDGST